MKILAIVLVVLNLTPALVLSSTPDEYAERIDNLREGDLPTKVGAYFDRVSPNRCKDSLISNAMVFKTSSGSAHEEKTPETRTTYDASYLVVRFCFSGSTFAGAYRELLDAAVVKAKRYGREDKFGVINPERPDSFSIIKSVDVSKISTTLYE